LIKNDKLGFKSGLLEIMETISSKISTHFQIEFVFNIDSDNSNESGVFHVVQLTQLPELKFEKIQFPLEVEHTYLKISSLQGHGARKNINSAIVVSPFIYTKEAHDFVSKKYLISTDR